MNALFKMIGREFQERIFLEIPRDREMYDD